MVTLLCISHDIFANVTIRFMVTFVIVAIISYGNNKECYHKSYGKHITIFITIRFTVTLLFVIKITIIIHGNKYSITIISYVNKI